MTEADKIRKKIMELQKLIGDDNKYSNNFNSVNSGINTNPTFKAVIYRDLYALNQLIESGIDVNMRSLNAEWTPLMLAASLGERKIIESLLEAGADISLLDASGMDVFVIAELYDQSESLDVLRKSVTSIID